MIQNKKNLLIYIGAVLIIGGIAYYFLQSKADPNSLPITETVEIAPGVTAEIERETEIATTSPLYLNPTTKAPALYPITSSPKSDALIASLKKEPKYIDWSDLGMYRKAAGDYKGAEEIWTYLITASPRGTDAYINLGDLYMYYLHNNAKAELMFLKAVEVSPRVVEAYRRIVDFYVTALQDKTKAKNFLEASIAKYPDMELSLQPLFAELK